MVFESETTYASTKLWGPTINAPLDIALKVFDLPEVATNLFKTYGVDDTLDMEIDYRERLVGSLEFRLGFGSAAITEKNTIDIDSPIDGVSVGIPKRNKYSLSTTQVTFFERFIFETIYTLRNISIPILPFNTTVIWALQTGMVFNTQESILDLQAEITMSEKPEQNIIMREGGMVKYDIFEF